MKGGVVRLLCGVLRNSSIIPSLSSMETLDQGGGSRMREHRNQLHERKTSSIMNRGILASAVLLAASLSLGCHLGPQKSGCSDCGGDCAGGGACAVVEPYGASRNYLPNGGQGGPLAGKHNKHFRGPQSHVGNMPGPATGPAQPGITYPYYTTRGPRDFLNPNPPSIGR